MAKTGLKKIYPIILAVFFCFVFGVDVCFAKLFQSDAKRKPKENNKTENKQDNKIEEPIVVNGDVVEYSVDNKEITATGNVMVNYKGTKLICKKLTVNTLTKDAVATGNVRIEDDKGVIEGEKITYNFSNKTGTIVSPEFRMLPLFGRSKEVERLNESEFTVVDGYATSCSFDRPHFRLRSKKIDFYPHDKIQTKNDIFFIGQTPVLFFPTFNASLKDRVSHVQLTPGKSGAWGAYMLSKYRVDLSDNFKGKLYLDYRTKLGPAGGVGANYITQQFGNGDFKYYYAHEKPSHPVDNKPTEFQRYFVRLRHYWEIDDRTKANLEFYKIKDSKRALGTDVNFLKDYFYREFEKDSQPPTYLTVNHAFNYSSLNFLMQKQVNHWYTHTDKVPDEKLPQIAYDLPQYQLGDSPFYYKNATDFSKLTNKNVGNLGINNEVSRFDTYNQFSLPFKASIFWLNPFVGTRETAYSRGVEGNSVNPRTVFYSGTDLSTKFYRTFNVRSNFWGMDINGLRHIITPTVRYAYNHRPTVAASKLQVFDDIDTIAGSNRFTFELMNKLQTKRTNKDKTLSSVDFVTFKINSDYNIMPKEGAVRGLSDILFDLEMLPYSWLRFYSDATYSRPNGYFKTANVDLVADFGTERSFGIGHRYERNGGKELTSGFTYRINPKWKFSIYERYQFAEPQERGLKEQEYTFTRDLHCWSMDFTYNINKDTGHTIWFVFRIKAFPDTEVKFNQHYYAPKSVPEGTTTYRPSGY